MPDIPDPVTEWSIETVGGNPPGELGAIWFATPLEVGTGALVLAGHVALGDCDTEIRIYQDRHLRAGARAAPGFSVAVPLVRGLYRLELWQAGTRLGQWDVVPGEQETAARRGMGPQREAGPGVTGPNAPYAIPGRMGEWFLAGDSNDSPGQFTERRRLAGSSVAAWQKVFDCFPHWRNSFEIDRLSLLVAPAKEEILREYYPFPRAPHTVLDDFIARFQDRPLIFPKWDLWNRRRFAYCATDTHWTDYGASVAAAAVLGSWEMAETGLPNSFGIVRRIGDLGNKVAPRVSGFEPMFPSGTRPVPAFDNGVHNQGCLRLWHSPGAPNPGSLMIFGDSFGTNLAEAFAGVFRKVVFAYQPAGFDPELVALLRPRHVLLQITQRFVHGHPATGASVFGKSRAKIAEMPEEARAALIGRLQGMDDEFQPLVARLLS